jgi:transcriptional regulator with XRE-family HTH domain
MEKTLHRREYRILLQLLIRARKDAGITQEALASALEVPRSTISKWETGEQRVDLLEFWSWCEAMGTDPLKLLASFKKSWKRG